MFNNYPISTVLFILWATLTVVPSASAQLQPNGEPCDGNCIGKLPACQNAWQPFASTVFLGRTTEVREQDVPITLHGKKSLTEKLWVTFAVEQSFIGPPQTFVTVTSGGDLCAFPFMKGYKYLVYAKRLPTGELYVSTCYGSKLATDAEDDLKYLRNLSSVPHGATVFGTAHGFTKPAGSWGSIRPVVPEVGQRVIIKGTTQSYESVVDEFGKFRISGLSPGRYTVSLESTGKISIFPPVKSTTVDIADKGCARFNFVVDPFAKPTD